MTAAAAVFLWPSAGLLARLYAIPEKAPAKKRSSGPSSITDAAGPPAVYATLTGLFIVLSFILFHPEGRGIRKAIDIQLHRGIGTVEKLYADAGSVKGEIKALSANVVKSFNTLGLLGGDEKKQ
jgi:hypothetical protein